ncbi:hypothetical protein [Thioclava sp.]|uniref:hypothetical protein n=1 Tax=Thioclava sp. TaxID=1933450 RepID=UPI003AA989B1
MPDKRVMTQRELKRLAAMFRAPHWEGVISVESAEALVCSGKIKTREFGPLDDFLCLRMAALNRDEHPTLSYLLENWNVAKLRLLRRVVWAIFGEDPILRALDVYIHERSGSTRKPPGGRKPRARRFSVPPEDLPAEWLEALGRMTDGLPSRFEQRQPPPVASMIQTTRTKLCELILVARQNNLEENISIETLEAYERSLLGRERPLSRVTIRSAIRQVHGFARYIGASTTVLEHLAARVCYHERRAALAAPVKEQRVLSLPSYEEIFEIALDMLGEAENTKNGVRAQFLRNAAVAITLFCPFPLRVADTVLRFGEEILWDDNGYRFNLIMSKSKRPFTAPVLPLFGFFIDQMILQGASSEHLQDLRKACFERKRRLFVAHDDSNLDPRYVSAIWSQVLGTGSHAARTKLHDEFGRLGSRGVELALLACGQRSEKTAEAYRTRAFKLLTIKKAHSDAIGEITDAEWKAYFGEL